MLPVLKPQQVIIALPGLSLQIDDVIVFQHQGLDKIKRIASIQADTLTVLGDNARVSIDSRSFGAVPKTDVLGKVIYPNCGSSAT